MLHHLYEAFAEATNVIYNYKLVYLHVYTKTIKSEYNNLRGLKLNIMSYLSHTRSSYIHVYTHTPVYTHYNVLTPASDANVQFLLPLLSSAILHGLSQSFSLVAVEGLSVVAAVAGTELPLLALAVEENIDDDDSILIII